MKQRGIKIGEVLVLEGVLKKEQLDAALQIQKTTGDFLGDILVKRKWASEDQISAALSKQFDIPFCALNFDKIDWEVVKEHELLLVEKNCFPFSQDGDSITVMIFNPLDALTISQIESQVGGRAVNLVLSTKTQIGEAIKEFKRRSLM